MIFQYVTCGPKLVLTDAYHRQYNQLEEICRAVRANVPEYVLFRMNIQRYSSANEEGYRIWAGRDADWMYVWTNTLARYRWQVYRNLDSGGPTAEGTDNAWTVITRLLAFVEGQPMLTDWYVDE